MKSPAQLRTPNRYSQAQVLVLVSPLTFDTSLHPSLILFSLFRLLFWVYSYHKLLGTEVISYRFLHSTHP